MWPWCSGNDCKRVRSFSAWRPSKRGQHASARAQRASPAHICSAVAGYVVHTLCAARARAARACQWARGANVDGAGSRQRTPRALQGGAGAAGAGKQAQGVRWTWARASGGLRERGAARRGRRARASDGEARWYRRSILGAESIQAETIQQLEWAWTVVTRRGGGEGGAGGPADEESGGERARERGSEGAGRGGRHAASGARVGYTGLIPAVGMRPGPPGGQRLIRRAEILLVGPGGVHELILTVVARRGPPAGPAQ
jgi:hypothetical protein